MTPLVFQTPFPRALRIFIGLFGLAFVILPGRDLVRILSRPDLGDIFFGALFALPVGVGAVLAAASVLGDALTVTVRGHQLSVHRRNLLREREDAFNARDISQVMVRKVEWESRADTWRVALKLAGRRLPLESADFDNERQAMDLKAAIDARLGKR